MKTILYIKSSSIKDVRMNKFYQFFKNRSDYRLYYWGWDRKKEGVESDSPFVEYFFKGVYLSLIASYLIYIFVLFFKLLFSNLNKYNKIICVNFESALPMYWVSRLKRIQYIYEIYDEFSKSYNFPGWIKRFLKNIDLRIVKRAEYVIHVDANRVLGPEKDKSIIIENTPNDHWNGLARPYDGLKHKFAIVGFFSDARGMEQIYSFAKDNVHIHFLLAGRFTSEAMKKTFLELKNVECHDFMPQEKLFTLMEDCCGIFSLYNPKIEINRYAASNKVYDAMMMGIPVITNREVINSSYIEKNRCGIVVDYEYGESWSQLSDETFVEIAKKIGSQGRSLYLDEFQFEALVKSRLLPIL